MWVCFKKVILQNVIVSEQDERTYLYEYIAFITRLIICQHCVYAVKYKTVSIMDYTLFGLDCIVFA